MRIRKWAIIFVFISLSLCLFSGCSRQQVQKDSKSTFTDSELQNIEKSNKVLMEEGFQMAGHLPDSLQKILSEITGWMKEAKPYTNKIPKSDDFTTSVYVGPAILSLTTADNNEIKLTPAYYVKLKYGMGLNFIYINNVICYSKNDKVRYFVLKELYDWLKNNKWKLEFHSEYE